MQAWIGHLHELGDRARARSTGAAEALTKWRTALQSPTETLRSQELGNLDEGPGRGRRRGVQGVQAFGIEPAALDDVLDGRQVSPPAAEGTTVTALLALAAERGIDLVLAMACGAPAPTARAGPGMPGSRDQAVPRRRTLPG